jgi:ABC-type transport system involved in multi-copper enzyme maturation permease subunit
VSLYRAETRRLVKRRFTKLFVLGVLLALAAVLAGVFFSNEKVSPERIARATAEAQANYQQALVAATQEKQACVAAQGTPAAGRFPPNCDEIYTPTEADFNPEWYMPATFDFRKNFPDMITTLAALLAVVAFVVGASFVGAEWSSGGMMNLLLWRPQRLRVLGTKLAALLVSIGALVVVVAAGWTAAFVGVAKARGSIASMTDGAWQSIGLMELRALALVLVAGALGFALASLGRHTAMALGVVIGLIIVFQFGLGTVLNLAKVKFSEAYLIPVWVTAWMNKSYKVEDYNSCDFSTSGGCQPDSFTITWQLAGSVGAAVFVVIVGAALWTMRKRDIT